MKFVKTLILLVLVSGLLVFFQNCGVAQNSGLLGVKESASSSVDKAITKAPFAYDLAVDTISYNSCVGEYLNYSGIHGIKIGANEGFTDNLGTGAVKAGLKLRSDFLKYIGQTLKPKYPSSVITPAQIQNALVNSPDNKDIWVQFAVRKASDLTVVRDLIQPTPASTISIPRDGMNFASLTQESIIQLLTKNVQYNEKGVILSEGSRIYNLADVTMPTPIEASFGYSNIVDETFPRLSQPLDTENFGIGELYSETVRNRFNLGSGDKHILAITYGSGSTEADNGLNSPKRKDEKDRAKAYGRAFSLSFGYPASAVAAGWKNNVLKEVRETNLEGGLVSGVSWNCSQYIIMKQNQWNSGKQPSPSCAPLIGSDLQDPIFAQKIRNIRRHYLEEEWNVGLFYDKTDAYSPATRGTRPICLVPKKSECYLPTENVVVPGTDIGVNYNPLNECYLYNRIRVSYVNPIETVRANGRCAQFASVCVRTSTSF